MSPEADDETLVVYSDYVCPFCYLGKASLEQYLESTSDPPDVEWRVFDLRGYKRDEEGNVDTSVEDGKDDQYFEQVRDNVQKLKREYGVEMNLDFSLEVDSWNALKAALFVKERERDESFLRFHEGLFQAIWKDQRDIGDPDVIADVAREAGLEPEPILEALRDKQWETELKSRFREAKRMGITGIPIFIYGRHAARGAVPPEQLKRLVEG